MIAVARQLGHSAAVCMRTYGHVIEEFDEAPRISDEETIRKAREAGVIRQVPADRS